jgi:hypothetical protein
VEVRMGFDGFVGSVLERVRAALFGVSLNDRLLDESILHWEDVAAWDGSGDSPYIYSVACPLCQVYMSVKTPVERECVGCPISERTGMRYCNGTPWKFVHVALELVEQATDDDRPRRVAEFRDRAGEMLEFLRETRGR